MSEYLPKLFKERLEGNINAKVDLSNYATKTDLKTVTHVDTSNFALTKNLTSLKTEVDKLDIDKLAPVPADLSKPSVAVKKKTVYDKLAAKVNNIDTKDFDLKTKYQTEKAKLKKKIPEVTDFVDDFVEKTKLTELENKIPDVISLATKTAFTAVENKIPSASSLVKKKTDYDTKITEMEKKLTDHNHDKYITTPEFSNLAADDFNARLALAKTDFDAKLSSLNRKITANKSNQLLVKSELKKLETFDLGYFIGQHHFHEDGTQNHLIFQPINRYFRVIANTKCISSLKSKGLSDETIKPIATSDNSLSPLIDYLDDKIRVKFNGDCLKQSKVAYTHRTTVNIYSVYELRTSSSFSNDPTLKNSLPGGVRLTKNADIDKYQYSGYRTGF